MIPRIPLFNPKTEFNICHEKIEIVFKRVAESGIYVNGAECQQFERRFSERCQIPFAVGVSSGTMALELILRADGIGAGSRVVITPHTFVAVLEAILNVGAEPLFVDIDTTTWQMPCGNWPDDAVMVCHLYGGFSNAIRSKARLLYEDASQSFGGHFKGRFLGSFGRAAAISFYPTKNLSALGDAGVIITHDENLAYRLRALRNHGQTAAQVHDYCGTTGRLDELQAGILFEKLFFFEQFLTERRRAASYYRDNLKELPLRLPFEVDDYIPAPNLFVIRVENRDELRKFLHDRGIVTGIHYPTPLHKMPAYREQPWAHVPMPQTERLCDEILSLPLWVGLTCEDQARVITAIREYFRAGT
jgi:UDP-2-acetamido-2-deoxy-ribo-hexuluronate aminotransferase